MKFLLALLIILTVSYLTSSFAAKKGRDPIGWFILGFFFGIFALAALFVLPSLNTKEEQPDQKSDDLAPFSPKESSDTQEDYRWYLIDINGKQKGPMDSVDLKIAWDDGLINNDCYVWHGGMGDWKKISSLKELELRLQGD